MSCDIPGRLERLDDARVELDDIIERQVFAF